MVMPSKLIRRASQAKTRQRKWSGFSWTTKRSQPNVKRRREMTRPWRIVFNVLTALSLML
jgi:hypothetical protein